MAQNIENPSTPDENGFWRRTFYFGPETKRITDPIDKLILSMDVTAKNRFNASMRLKRDSSIAFFTTTSLSLGLILIPLLLNSDIKLAFQPKTLNMLQIFMAVAVLVYSVINSKANYETRAEKLNMCGDKIKELSRDLAQKKSKGESIDFKEFVDKYNEITRDSENHIRLDYFQTKLQMERSYRITGIKRSIFWLWLRIRQGLSVMFPLTMLAGLIIFVTEMLGASRISDKLLNGASQDKVAIPDAIPAPSPTVVDRGLTPRSTRTQPQAAGPVNGNR
jgi:hypothetical protein